MDVLVRDHARDGRLVHADVVGDVPKHERPEMLDAVIQELPLVPDDRVGDLVDRALALVEALDQPDGRPHLVLEIVRGLGADRAVAAPQQPAVGRRNPQLRQAVLGELDDVLVADLADEDVRLDVDRPLARVLAAGLRLEVLDDLERRLDLRHPDAELLGQRRELPVQELGPVLPDDPFDQRVLDAEGGELDQKAVRQVEGADARRIEGADQGQRRVHVGLVFIVRLADLLARDPQVPVLVDVADEIGRDLPNGPAARRTSRAARSGTPAVPPAGSGRSRASTPRAAPGTGGGCRRSRGSPRSRS